MFANARMYSVSPAAGATWRALFHAVIDSAGLPIEIIDYPAPAPLEALWQRPDQGAVFMCGLPFSLAEPPPVLVAAPVPAAAEFGGRPEYFSEFVVRADDPAQVIDDTFGRRLAGTVPTSQSGWVAALTFFMELHRAAAPRAAPLFAEIIGPTVTPMGALSAVAEGAADVAPIDAYALRLLARYRPEMTARVRVIGRTASTPIPPLVASAGLATSAETLAGGFSRAHEIAAAIGPMADLCLSRFVRPDACSYALLRSAHAAAAAYWRSHVLAARVHPGFTPLTFPGQSSTVAG